VERRDEERRDASSLGAKRRVMLEVTVTGAMWLYEALCGAMRLYVALCGAMRLYVALCGAMRPSRYVS
jgi:hypothetical protein